MKRLDEIRSKPSDRIDNIMPNWKRSHSHMANKAEKFRRVEIDRENKKMLSKIEEIINSQRRPKLTVSGPITLNFNARKQKVDQILAENKALMRRISNSSAHISIKEILKEKKPKVSRKRYLNKPKSMARLPAV